MARARSCGAERRNGVVGVVDGSGPGCRMLPANVDDAAHHCAHHEQRHPETNAAENRTDRSAHDGPDASACHNVIPHIRPHVSIGHTSFATGSVRRRDRCRGRRIQSRPFGARSRSRAMLHSANTRTKARTDTARAAHPLPMAMVAPPLANEARTNAVSSDTHRRHPCGTFRCALAAADAVFVVNTTGTSCRNTGALRRAAVKLHADDRGEQLSDNRARGTGTAGGRPVSRSTQIWRRPSR